MNIARLGAGEEVGTGEGKGEGAYWRSGCQEGFKWHDGGLTWLR